jgi:hypothetical protein
MNAPDERMELLGSRCAAALRPAPPPRVVVIPPEIVSAGHR